MKLDSKHFDCIRPKGRQSREAEENQRVCDVDGCEAKGLYPAPGDNKKRRFLCLAHVREANDSYNYFAGKPEGSTGQAYSGEGSGERPTWKLGQRHARLRTRPRLDDPMEFFRLRQGTMAHNQKEARRKQAKGPVLNALETLGVAHDASAKDIRSRFKELAKMHHPDLNGGNREGEEQLKSCIQAYALLKKNGFC